MDGVNSYILVGLSSDWAFRYPKVTQLFHFTHGVITGKLTIWKCHLINTFSGISLVLEKIRSVIILKCLLLLSQKKIVYFLLKALPYVKNTLDQFTNKTVQGSAVPRVSIMFHVMSFGPPSLEVTQERLSRPFHHAEFSCSAGRPLLQARRCPRTK